MSGHPKCCDEPCVDDCDSIDGAIFRFIGADETNDEMALPVDPMTGYGQYDNTETIDTQSVTVDASEYYIEGSWGNVRNIDNITNAITYGCPPYQDRSTGRYGFCNEFLGDYFRRTLTGNSTSTLTIVTKRITQLYVQKGTNYVATSCVRGIRFEYTLAGTIYNTVTSEVYRYSGGRTSGGGHRPIDNRAGGLYYTQSGCGSPSTYPMTDYNWGVPCEYQDDTPYGLGCVQIDNDVIVNTASGSMAVTNSSVSSYSASSAHTFCCEEGLKYTKQFNPHSLSIIGYFNNGKHAVDTPRYILEYRGGFGPGYRCLSSPGPIPDSYPDLECNNCGTFPRTCTYSTTPPFLPANVYLSQKLGFRKQGYFDRTNPSPYYNECLDQVCNDDLLVIGSAGNDIRKIEIELY